MKENITAFVAIIFYLVLGIIGGYMMGGHHIYEHISHFLSQHPVHLNQNVATGFSFLFSVLAVCTIIVTICLSISEYENHRDEKGNTQYVSLGKTVGRIVIGFSIATGLGLLAILPWVFI